ncbi:MAG: hypothetical protein V2J24_19700 [Pseudomonadales bacterium]|jgi:hypothetical protein|nr:hypothetical protein [Pseudomonadales bacterium]
MDMRFAELWPAWRADPGDPALEAALRALAREEHPAAAQALAVRAFEGHGQPRDAAAAFAWSLRAAHGGFAAGAAMAGNFFLHAEPEFGACARDAERALHWHDRAGLAGHAQAALVASDSHRMGRGGARDFGRAWLFLRIALALFERPPPITEILVPSLQADLGAEARARIDAEADALIATLPRADASLEHFWAQEHTRIAEQIA